MLIPFQIYAINYTPCLLNKKHLGSVFYETKIMVLISENSDLNLKLLGMPRKGDDMT